eukprot:867990-Amphidinium_carterae.1
MLLEGIADYTPRAAHTRSYPPSSLRCVCGLGHFPPSLRAHHIGINSNVVEASWVQHTPVHMRHLAAQSNCLPQQAH